MRFLLGVIVGVALTIGGAYVYDARVYDTRLADGAAVERPMVNWDVVGRNWNQFTARVRDEWTRLIG